MKEDNPSDTEINLQKTSTSYNLGISLLIPESTISGLVFKNGVICQTSVTNGRLYIEGSATYTKYDIDITLDHQSLDIITDDGNRFSEDNATKRFYGIDIGAGWIIPLRKHRFILLGKLGYSGMNLEFKGDKYKFSRNLNLTPAANFNFCIFDNSGNAETIKRTYLTLEVGYRYSIAEFHEDIKNDMAYLAVGLGIGL
ncbi:hypothetical protein K4L44_12600 [Halosquirtibacter laminarini]|uniref:Uncharacterized protein n=1 Tax=Halosquirtibacter laminarini TaxID=3374600 RepID=A0AC61ND05_9BACT|nr:hypothetical protein K4L44_12600 [Prolixibacteraceae bacterium]